MQTGSEKPPVSPSKSEEKPAVSTSEPKSVKVPIGGVATANASVSNSMDSTRSKGEVFEGPRQGPDSTMKSGGDPAVSGQSGQVAVGGTNDMTEGDEAVDSVGAQVVHQPLMTGVTADDTQESIPQKDTKGNKLQLYTPSSMLDWGQFEVKYFQQLYSQTSFWNAEGEAVPLNNRSNYYSGIFNFVLGYNKRLNFGVDAWLQSVFIDSASGSPFRLFTRPSGAMGRTAITAIGPKIKWQPFARLNGLTLQSSLLLPVARDPEGRNNNRPFLATQNIIWWTQVFYTYNISQQFQLFAEIDFYWNVDRQLDFQQSGFIAMPMSAFFSYFPTGKATLYANTQLWPILGEGVVSSWWWMAGVGGKYQFSPSVDIELSYGRFLMGRGSAGPAQTFNLGLRFVKW